MGISPDTQKCLFLGLNARQLKALWMRLRQLGKITPTAPERLLKIEEGEDRYQAAWRLVEVHGSGPGGPERHR